MRREATAQNVKAEVVFKNKFSLGNGFVVDAETFYKLVSHGWKLTLQRCSNWKLHFPLEALALIQKGEVKWSHKVDY